MHTPNSIRPSIHSDRAFGTLKTCDAWHSQNTKAHTTRTMRRLTHEPPHTHTHTHTQHTNKKPTPDTPTTPITQKCIEDVCFRSAVARIPFLFLMYDGYTLLGMPPMRTPLPPLATVLAHWAVALVVNDTLFYWTHRLMHHRVFYKRLHKKHHEFKVGVGRAWMRMCMKACPPTDPTTSPKQRQRQRQRQPPAPDPNTPKRPNPPPSTPRPPPTHR